MNAGMGEGALSQPEGHSIGGGRERVFCSNSEANWIVWIGARLMKHSLLFKSQTCLADVCKIPKDCAHLVGTRKCFAILFFFA